MVWQVSLWLLWSSLEILIQINHEFLESQNHIFTIFQGTVSGTELGLNQCIHPWEHSLQPVVLTGTPKWPWKVVESSCMYKWQSQLTRFRNFPSSVWDFIPPYPSLSDTLCFLTPSPHNPQTLIFLLLCANLEARNEKKGIPCSSVPNSHTPRGPILLLTWKPLP